MSDNLFSHLIITELTKKITDLESKDETPGGNNDEKDYKIKVWIDGCQK